MTAIEITVNGEPKCVPLETSVAELLEQLHLNSRALAVEINQQISPRDAHSETKIQSGDVLEIVTLVGGG